MFREIIRITRTVLNRLKNRFYPQNIVATTQKTYEIQDIKRYLDEEDRRHYQQNGDDVYSVTTILDELEEGENEGLKWWKKHNDGKGDNANWEHLLEYKKNRGTLAHHAAMANQYEEINHGEKLWSSDETDSLYELMDREGDQRFLYSIMHDKEWVSTREGFENILQEKENIQVTDLIGEDLEYFTNEYDKICREKGINTDTIEAIEEMFIVPENNQHNGYGGQVDIVYRDPLTGEAVVADLKTSSAVRDKHKYQAAAYAKAVENTDNLPIEKVGRAEIIRIHPDSRESEIYEFSDFDQYYNEFAETSKKL